MLEAGFQKRADELNEQISQLRRQNENIKKPSWLSGILDVATMVLPGVLPRAVGKAIGAVTNFFRRL